MRYSNVELHNVEEALDGEPGQGKLLSRIPDDLRVGLNDFACNYALQTAGCEVRFNLEGDEAMIRLQSPDRPVVAEVYQGAFFVAWHVVGTTPIDIVVKPLPENETLARLNPPGAFPFDLGLTRVRLPWDAATRLLAIEGDVSPPRPEQTPARRWLAYGSSITQGYQGICPTDGYAARTALALGVDLLNLGFAGGAHLEPQMVDYIAARDDWDFATLEMGINLIKSTPTEEFERRVQYFVPTVARRHPGQWVFCIDLFTCGFDFDHDPKIEAYRDVVRRTVEGLCLPRLVHISGTDLLRSPDGLTFDLVHPSRAGMQEMAGNLARRIADTMGVTGTHPAEARSSYV